jgi:hypothetical protein
MDRDKVWPQITKWDSRSVILYSSCLRMQQSEEYGNQELHQQIKVNKWPAIAGLARVDIYTSRPSNACFLDKNKYQGADVV